MLVKESGQRVTMPEIMAHPWFQRNMPAGLLHINSRVDPSKARQVGNYKRTTDLLVLSETVLVGFWGGVSSRLPTRLPPRHAVWVRPPPSLPLTLPPSLPPTQPRACVQSEAEVVSVVREAQQSLRVIDADNIDEMADDILAEEEADDLLEGEWWCVLVWMGFWLAQRAGGWMGGGICSAWAVCSASAGVCLLHSCQPDPEGSLQTQLMFQTHRPRVCLLLQSCP